MMDYRYQKQILLLKGDATSILTIETRDQLHYTLTGATLPTDAKLILLSRTENSGFLPVPQGTCRKLSANICAAAIAAEGRLIRTGSLEVFDWSNVQLLLQKPAEVKNPPAFTVTAASDQAECPCIVSRQSAADPFPALLPDVQWQRIEYPAFIGSSHYLIGQILRDRKYLTQALAIPGEYSANPPPWLTGFDRFVRSHTDRQGYWLFIKDTASVQDQPTTSAGLTRT